MEAMGHEDPEGVAVPADGEDAAPRAAGHGPGWDSALYRFAEGIRALTSGHVGHKAVYAAVGTNGRLINHASPLVRKRTASSLSRLMHSSRYAADLRARHQEDEGTFTAAAHELVDQLRTWSGLGAAALLMALLDDVWPRMCEGLTNEWHDGRTDVSPRRVERESAALRLWCLERSALGHPPLEELVASAFHMMAYGCLDERFAHALLLPTPEEPLELTATGGPVAAVPLEGTALLVRVPDDRTAAVSGLWRIEADRPFWIGRGSDCDAIEADSLVSRVHCRICCVDGTWYVEDVASTHGTQVLRGAAGSTREVFCSLDDPDVPTCRLEYGDRIVLAGRITYWFRALAAGGLE